MSEKKQLISLAFSKIESLETVEDINDSKKAIDVQECFCLKTPVGHRSNWVEVYANNSALETLKGFQEGLKKLHADFCENLKTAVGLPASCEDATFDGSSIRALYEIDQRYYTAAHMTAGIKTLSLRQCQLWTLRGIAPTCETLKIDETRVLSLDDLPHGIKNISATSCKYLKTTKGLPSSCQFLDLSFSAIEMLEDIPVGIEEIRVYNCNQLKKECLKSVPVSVLPRIKGLTSDAAEYARLLITVAQKQKRKSGILRNQKING